ncbi:MAG: CBS domain-containing protein [Chromatiaceae bacterium]|nr:CBS domain-containing protein [Chromatiaceae bacterium]
MKLTNILIPTKVAEAGMLMREMFEECTSKNVPGLPFRDAKGKIIGRVSLRHTFKLGCLPDYMVEMAFVLGDNLNCMDDAEAKAHAVMCSTVDRYMRREYHAIDSDSPVMRALAIMEKLDTSYLFVIDNGVYKGTVTTQGIARRMLDVENNRETG